jgi:imidazolonepropionase-like amidohydrolase
VVIREGGDWIKIAASGGMTSPRGMPEHGGLTRAEMAAVVTEAERHGGIGVAAHAQGTRAVGDAVAAGVRSIEHGYGIDDATIQEMGEQGTFLVPTLSTLTRHAEARQPTPQQETPRQSRLRRFRELAVERLHVAVSSGIPIALGTDAGVVPHGSNLREVALLVRFGLSPLQAITAGTSAAARLLGLDGETGTLHEGLAADLIAVRGDPLADPGLLAEPDAIRLVMRQGSIEREEIS